MFQQRQRVALRRCLPYAEVGLVISHTPTQPPAQRGLYAVVKISKITELSDRERGQAMRNDDGQGLVFHGEEEGETAFVGDGGRA